MVEGAREDNRDQPRLDSGGKLCQEFLIKRKVEDRDQEAKQHTLNYYSLSGA